MGNVFWMWEWTLVKDGREAKSGRWRGPGAGRARVQTTAYEGGETDHGIQMAGDWMLDAG